jgi:hypothetical protein
MRMFPCKSSPLVVRKEIRESRGVPLASLTEWQNPFVELGP